MYIFGFALKSAKTEIPLVVEGCLGGYSLSSLVDASSFQYCSCEKNQRQVILCEDDQDSVIIEVHSVTIICSFLLYNGALVIIGTIVTFI